MGITRRDLLAADRDRDLFATWSAFKAYVAAQIRQAARSDALIADVTAPAVPWLLGQP